MSASKIKLNELREKIKSLSGLEDEEKARLLELLSEQKRYGLVWEDHAEDVEEELRTKLPVLTEVKERQIISDDPDAPNHILIEGDNLHALNALTYTHEGKIDVIYIDPPYNTGNKDFVYNDSFVDSEDGYRHSKWLSFMSKRLRIAKRLLSDRGVIFISIDDNEQANLKLLCDEVFGENLFITDIIWRSSDSSNHDAKQFSVDFNHTIVYSKTDNWMPNKIERTEDNNAHYKNPDNDPNGPWFSSNVQSPHPRQNLTFDIISPQGHTIHPPKNGWRWSFETMQGYINSGAIIFVEDGKRLIKKTYLKDQSGIVPSNIWWDIEVTGHNRNAKYELKKIFPEKKTSELFSTPKPTKFIKRILEISTHKKSIILDFFAGSGTTLHSVMQQNESDGGSRQCILVTNNENGICENTTYERNRRIINGYKNSSDQFIEGLKSNNLRYYRTDFVNRERTPKNMRQLMNLSTDLLCIKENLYKKEASFGSLPKNDKIYHYYDDGKKQMLVIFKEEYIDHFVKQIKEMEVKDPIKVYLFSPSRNAFTDEFIEVEDKVKCVALPAAIYDAYQRVLPKYKDPLLEDVKKEEVTSNADGGQLTIEF